MAPAGGDRLDWFAALSAHGALLAVDMAQRVVACADPSGQLFAAPERAIGRRCYEVMSALDPRNDSLCGPGCPVTSAARRGQASPDFEAWTGDGHSRVSTLLHAGDGRVGPVALHYVRPSSPPVARAARAPVPVRRALRATAEDQSRPAAPLVVLTARQQHVLARMAAGMSAAEVAAELGLRPVTVRNHVQAAMERLGARTRLGAVVAAARDGLI